MEKQIQVFSSKIIKKKKILLIKIQVQPLKKSIKTCVHQCMKCRILRKTYNPPGSHWSRLPTIRISTTGVRNRRGNIYIVDAHPIRVIMNSTAFILSNRKQITIINIYQKLSNLLTKEVLWIWSLLKYHTYRSVIFAPLHANSFTQSYILDKVVFKER